MKPEKGNATEQGFRGVEGQTMNATELQKDITMNAEKMSNTKSNLLDRLKASDNPRLALLEEAIAISGETPHGVLIAKTFVDFFPQTLVFVLACTGKEGQIDLSTLADKAIPELAYVIPETLFDNLEWVSRNCHDSAGGLMLIDFSEEMFAKLATSTVNLTVRFLNDAIGENGWLPDNYMSNLIEVLEPGQLAKMKAMFEEAEREAGGA